MILSILAIVLAVAAIVYTGHTAIVFQKFNDGIKDWAEALDASTREAINRSARQILKDLDEQITRDREAQESGIEDVEPLNDEKDE